MTNRFPSVRLARAFTFAGVFLLGCGGDDAASSPEDASIDATTSEDAHVDSADDVRVDTGAADAGVDSAGDADAGVPSCASRSGNCQVVNQGQCKGGGIPVEGNCPAGEECCLDMGQCNGAACCVGCTCWEDGGCSICNSSHPSNECNSCGPSSDGGCLIPCGAIQCASGCRCVDADGGGACACP